jgi:hypothetical protein
MRQQDPKSNDAVGNGLFGHFHRCDITRGAQDRRSAVPNFANYRDGLLGPNQSGVGRG